MNKETYELPDSFSALRGEYLIFEKALIQATEDEEKSYCKDVLAEIEKKYKTMQSKEIQSTHRHILKLSKEINESIKDVIDKVSSLHFALGVEKVMFRESWEELKND